MTLPGTRILLPSRVRPRSLRAVWLLLLLVVPLAAAAGIALYFSNPKLVPEFPSWFDPAFFQYNLLLLLVFVLMVPAITYVYIGIMRSERLLRLKQELSESNWQANEEHINNSVNAQFGVRNYLGSTIILMVVIGLGLSVTL